MKSRPVVITFSILAGLGVLTASAGLSDLIGVKLALILVLAREAVQVGMNFYVQSMVTPNEDVVAYTNKDGQSVAGPASGTTNGTPVDVVRTDPLPLPPAQ